MDLVELHANGRSVSETLPWTAMDVRTWNRRNRIAYDAPLSVISAYHPLASTTFKSLNPFPEGQTTPMMMIGDLGLGFGLDENRKPVVSVEAMALEQLVTSPGDEETLPNSLRLLASTWTLG